MADLWYLCCEQAIPELSKRTSLQGAIDYLRWKFGDYDDDGDDERDRMILHQIHDALVDLRPGQSAKIAGLTVWAVYPPES